MSLKSRYETDLRFFYFTKLSSQVHSHFLSSNIILNVETKISVRQYEFAGQYGILDEHQFKITIKVEGKIVYSRDGLKMSSLGIENLHPLDLIYSKTIYDGLLALNNIDINKVLIAYRNCFADAYDIKNYLNYVRVNKTPNFFLFTKPYFLDNYIATIELRRDTSTAEPDIICCWTVLYNYDMQRIVTGYGEKEVTILTDYFELENTCWQLLLDKCEKNVDYINYSRLKSDVRNRNLDLIIMEL